MLTVQDLQQFEKEVEEQFISGKIRGPIHLSGGNEKQLIEIFEKIYPCDWVFSTYRNHFHALLHGIPRDELMAEIVAGRNMNFSSAKHRFFTSAIVGGTLPIAVGVAAAIKSKWLSPFGKRFSRMVWCFVGDMAATTGAFHDAAMYAQRNDLPIKFVIENNEMSANTPTISAWGDENETDKIMYYNYKRTYPHAGASKWVEF